MDNFYESSLYWLQRGQKEAGSELMGLADLDSNYHSPHAFHVLLVARRSLVYKYLFGLK